MRPLRQRVRPPASSERKRAGDCSPARATFCPEPYSEKIDFLWVPFGTRSAPITTVIKAIVIGYQRPE